MKAIKHQTQRNTGYVGSKMCSVCDAEILYYRKKCIKCGAMLMKKKRSRSAPTNEKRLKKKKKITCLGNKKKYYNKSHVVKTIKKIYKNTGRQSRVYRCKGCKCFHLTKYRC